MGASKDNDKYAKVTPFHPPTPDEQLFEMLENLKSEIKDLQFE